MRGRIFLPEFLFLNPISVTSVASCETGRTDAQIMIPKFFEQKVTEETENFVSNQFESLSYRFEPGRMRGSIPSRSFFFLNPISVTSVAFCETGRTDAQM